MHSRAMFFDYVWRIVVGRSGFVLAVVLVVILLPTMACQTTTFGSKNQTENCAMSFRVPHGWEVKES
ncbi:MAG: hypothetical protein ABFS37_02885, partial [Acidobacteriota bacterium]